MNGYRWTAAAVSSLALIATSSVAVARPQADGPGRVLQEAEKGGEARALVVESMRKVRHQAGFFGAIALPSRFGGVPILAAPTGDEAQRSSTESHYLNYGFSDGSDLLYYSDFAPDFSTVSVWETGPDGASGTSLYGTVSGGAYASRSIGLYESWSEAGMSMSEGTSMWMSSWDEGDPEPAVSATLTEYSSVYSPASWSYEGVDHHYLDFSRVIFSGGGTVSADGAFSSFEGVSLIEDASGRVQECFSTGQSLSDYGESYAITSDYWDECEQFAEPYHFYYAHNHTEYSWDYATYMSSYDYAGTVECSDITGESRRYTVEYDAEDWGYRYTDMDTGTAVGQVDCAWDPWADSLQD